MTGKWYKEWKKKWKKGLACVLVLMAAAALGACGKDEGGNSKETEGEKETEEGDVSKEPEPDRHHVEITVKDYGTISVELYREAAPITVDNFLKLAEDGFYDGLTFHRVVADFVIQGGDPEGTGYGGAAETIKGEFSSNGVENNLSHTRGAVSMARSNDKDSASSQFFIVHKDSLRLDGEYACFGYVTEGMEVVDAICENTPVTPDTSGFVEKENQPVIESIKVID